MFEQHTYTHNRDCGVDSCFASNIVPTGAKVILKLNFEIVCTYLKFNAITISRDKSKSSNLLKAEFNENFVKPKGF